jgi:hypothetical protein
MKFITLLGLPVSEALRRDSYFNSGEALEENGFLPDDTTSGGFKHSEMGTSERRSRVADDCYNMCINASVKRAPHLCRK